MNLIRLDGQIYKLESSFVKTIDPGRNQIPLLFHMDLTHLLRQKRQESHGTFSSVVVLCPYFLLRIKNEYIYSNFAGLTCALKHFQNDVKNAFWSLKRLPCVVTFIAKDSLLRGCFMHHHDNNVRCNGRRPYGRSLTVAPPSPIVVLLHRLRNFM